MIRSTLSKFKVHLYGIRRLPKSTSSGSKDDLAHSPTFVPGYPEHVDPSKHTETDIKDTFIKSINTNQFNYDKVQNDLKEKTANTEEILESIIISEHQHHVNIEKTDVGIPVVKRQEKEIRHHDINKQHLLDNFYNEKLNYGSSEADKQIGFDEIAIKCLNTPVHKIDEQLLKEIENIKIHNHDEEINIPVTVYDDKKNVTHKVETEVELGTRKMESALVEDTVEKSKLDEKVVKQNEMTKFEVGNLIQYDTSQDQVATSNICENCIVIVFDDNGFNVESYQKTVLATTAKDDVEKLAQKLEILDEVPLVEAERNYVAGFNVPPKVLGDKLSFLYCEIPDTEKGKKKATQKTDSQFSFKKLLLKKKDKQYLKTDATEVKEIDGHTTTIPSKEVIKPLNNPATADDVQINSIPSKDVIKPFNNPATGDDVQINSIPSKDVIKPFNNPATGDDVQINSLKFQDQIKEKKEPIHTLKEERILPHPLSNTPLVLTDAAEAAEDPAVVVKNTQSTFEDNSQFKHQNPHRPQTSHFHQPYRHAASTNFVNHASHTQFPFAHRTTTNFINPFHPQNPYSPHNIYGNFGNHQYRNEPQYMTYHKHQKSWLENQMKYPTYSNYNQSVTNTTASTNMAYPTVYPNSDSDSLENQSSKSASEQETDPHVYQHPHNIYGNFGHQYGNEPQSMTYHENQKSWLENQINYPHYSNDNQSVTNNTASTDISYPTVYPNSVTNNTASTNIAYPTVYPNSDRASLENQTSKSATELETGPYVNQQNNKLKEPKLSKNIPPTDPKSTHSKATPVKDIFNKSTVIHPAHEETTSRVDPLEDSSIPATEINADTLSLKELLQRARDQNNLEMVCQILARMQEVDPTVGMSITGFQKPCHPPLPTSPNVVGPLRPSPCPRARPKPKPKPSSPPPKQNPCAKFTSNPNDAAVESMSILPSLMFSTSFQFDLPITDGRYAALTEEVREKIHNLGKILFTTCPTKSVYHFNPRKTKMVEVDGEMAEEDHIIKARNFEPWIPIPSWPMPEKIKKMPPQTPLEGCKPGLTVYAIRRSSKSTSSGSKDNSVSSPTFTSSGYPEYVGSSKCPETDIKDSKDAFINAVQKKNPSQTPEMNATVSQKDVVLHENKEAQDGIEVEDNYKETSERDKQMAYDEIAKRCLGTPIYKIDEQLLKEMEHVKIHQRGDDFKNPSTDDCDKDIVTKNVIVEGEVELESRDIENALVKDLHYKSTKIDEHKLKQNEIRDLDAENLIQYKKPKEQEEICEKIIFQVFGEFGMNKDSKHEKEYNPTIAKDSDKNLTPNIEVIEETTLPKAEKKYVENFYLSPKVLSKSVLYCESTNKTDKTQINSAQKTAPEIAFQKISEVYLENDDHKIKTNTPEIRKIDGSTTMLPSTEGIELQSNPAVDIFQIKLLKYEDPIKENQETDMCILKDERILPQPLCNAPLVVTNPAEVIEEPVVLVKDIESTFDDNINQFCPPNFYKPQTSHFHQSIAHTASTNIAYPPVHSIQFTNQHSETNTLDPLFSSDIAEKLQESSPKEESSLVNTLGSEHIKEHEIINTLKCERVLPHPLCNDPLILTGSGEVTEEPAILVKEAESTFDDNTNKLHSPDSPHNIYGSFGNVEYKNEAQRMTYPENQISQSKNQTFYPQTFNYNQSVEQTTASTNISYPPENPLTFPEYQQFVRSSLDNQSKTTDSPTEQKTVNHILEKSAVVHPPKKEMPSQVDFLKDISSIPSLEVNADTQSLNEMLRRIRERSFIEFLRHIEARMNEVDPEVGTCKDDTPKCPPPAPKCPPPKPKCPPPKPKCPPPKPKCPPSPCPKPKCPAPCPPPEPKCPPPCPPPEPKCPSPCPPPKPKDPCAKFTSISINNFITDVKSYVAALFKYAIKRIILL